MARNGALSEEEKMRMVPGIIYEDGAIGRRAHVVGSGLDVFEVITTYVNTAKDEQRIIEGYRDWLTPEQVKAALEFYRLFPEEIDERLALEAAGSPDRVRAAVEARYGASAR